MSEADLEKLVKEVLATEPGNIGCKFVNLEGQAREFMDAMIIAEQTGGRTVNRKKVVKVLRETFGIQVSASAVRRHLKKECSKCNTKDQQN